MVEAEVADMVKEQMEEMEELKIHLIWGVEVEDIFLEEVIMEVEVEDILGMEEMAHAEVEVDMEMEQEVLEALDMALVVNLELLMVVVVFAFCNIMYNKWGKIVMIHLHNNYCRLAPPPVRPSQIG